MTDCGTIDHPLNDPALSTHSLQQNISFSSSSISAQSLILEFVYADSCAVAFTKSGTQISTYMVSYASSP